MTLLHSNRAMGRVTPCALLTLAILHLSATRTSPPHIVFILADDLVSYSICVYDQVWRWVLPTLCSYGLFIPHHFSNS